VNTRYLLKALAGLAAAVGIALLVARFAFASPRQVETESEPYRVELVANDVYKVQKALNANAALGWWYDSSIPRQDGKLLLVFRRSQ
jgi:hypothetical protein